MVYLGGNDYVTMGGGLVLSATYLVSEVDVYHHSPSTKCDAVNDHAGHGSER